MNSLFGARGGRSHQYARQMNEDDARCASALKSMIGLDEESQRAMRMHDLSDAELVTDPYTDIQRQEDARDENPVIHRPRTLPDECVFTCGQMCAWICRFLCVPSIVYLNRHSVAPRYQIPYGGSPVYERALVEGHRGASAPRARRDGQRYAGIEMGRAPIDESRYSSGEENVASAANNDPRARLALTDDDREESDDGRDDEDDSDNERRVEVVNVLPPPNSAVPRDSAVDVYSDDDDETLARIGNTRIVSTSSVVRRQVEERRRSVRPTRIVDPRIDMFESPAVVHSDESEEIDDDDDEPLNNNDRSQLDGLALGISRMIDKKRELAKSLRARESSRSKTSPNNESSSLLQDGLGSESESDDGDEDQLRPSDRVELICTWLEKVKAEVEAVREAVSKNQIKTRTARAFIEEVSEVIEDRILVQFQQGVITELPAAPLCFGD